MLVILRYNLCSFLVDSRFGNYNHSALQACDTGSWGAKNMSTSILSDYSVLASADTLCKTASCEGWGAGVKLLGIGI